MAMLMSQTITIAKAMAVALVKARVDSVPFAEAKVKFKVDSQIIKVKFVVSIQRLVI